MVGVLAWNVVANSVWTGNFAPAAYLPLRNTEKVILVETTDYKELRVFFEIARIIESSTNSLMKAAFGLRNNILEGLNW